LNSVLCIDDDQDYREYLSIYLSEKYDVITQSNGPDGIIAAKEVQPVLILLDAIMPGMDGLETCKLLKEDPLTANIPVIILSCSNDKKIIDAGFMAGAVGHLFKPLCHSEIFQCIEQHIYNSD